MTAKGSGGRDEGDSRSTPHWEAVDHAVRRVARLAADRYVDKADRDDAVQDAVLWAWLKREDFMRLSPTEQRMRIYYHVRDYAKTLRRRAARFTDDFPFDGGRPGARTRPTRSTGSTGSLRAHPDATSQIDDQAILYPPLKRLAHDAPRQASAVWLHGALGLTYREVGEVTGTSEGSVKKNFHEGRRKLGTAIQPPPYDDDEDDDCDHDD